MNQGGWYLAHLDSPCQEGLSDKEGGVMSDQPCGACLVGSVPLTDADAVFNLAGEILGPYLKRIPDGETGDRSNWISWQMNVFEQTQGLTIVDIPGTEYNQARRIATLAEGTDPDGISFPPLGYASAALTSYETFLSVRSDGKIPASCRFLVCLPTPLAPLHLYFPADQGGLVEASYESAMLRELDEILKAIPAQDLAIQWDTAVEFGILEGAFPTYLNSPGADIEARLLRLGDAVPAGVELGYHLCYGDAGHRHFVEPRDMTRLVDLANALASGVKRSIEWIHMPVPRDRDDPAYFSPLSNLNMPQGTDIYLGLVHMTDGVEGAEKRVRSAQAFLTSFGVATECGFGRRPPETVPALMNIHAEVAEPLSVD